MTFPVPSFETSQDRAYAAIEVAATLASLRIPVREEERANLAALIAHRIAKSGQSINILTVRKGAEFYRIHYPRWFVAQGQDEDLAHLTLRRPLSRHAARRSRKPIRPGKPLWPSRTKSDNKSKKVNDDHE